jgi:hypothetical protein
MNLQNIIEKCCDGDNRHKWAKFISVQCLDKYYDQYLLEIDEREIKAENREFWIENNICPVCGESLHKDFDNVGFNEYPLIEIWYECPNGCDF